MPDKKQLYSAGRMESGKDHKNAEMSGAWTVFLNFL